MYLNYIPGFTFIEILISLLIVSLVILGFSTIELTALTEIQSSYFYSVAAVQFNGMQERLYALGQYSNLNLSNEINNWNAENKTVLPNGKGEVDGQYPSYRIKLCWGKQVCLQE